MPDQLPTLPELFELDYGSFDDDLPFYESLARRGDGPALELGCGFGRAAIALARAGSEVWGIDTSPEMLEYAKAAAGPELTPRLHLCAGDMRDFDLGRRFDLIFAGYGAFHHLLTPEDQLACLRCVERHLTPDGVFVCDLRPLLSADWATGDSVPLLRDWTRTLPRSGEAVTKLRAVRAEPAAQVQHELHHFDIVSPDGAVRRVTAEIDLRFSSRYEMEALLREATLVLDALYGSYDLDPYNDESDYMIITARSATKDST